MLCVMRFRFRGNSMSSRICKHVLQNFTRDIRKAEFYDNNGKDRHSLSHSRVISGV